MQHLVIFGVLMATAADPFNPSAYLGARQEEQVHADEATGSHGLTGHAIYRLNGMRFHRLASASGAVYLPGAGETPELQEEFALCEQHLKLLGGEVLRVRDGLPINGELKAAQAKVLGMIAKCKDGLVKSPTLTVTKPDGAVVEIKAKDPSSASNKTRNTRDDAFDEREDAAVPTAAAKR